MDTKDVFIELRLVYQTIEYFVLLLKSLVYIQRGWYSMTKNKKDASNVFHEIWREVLTRFLFKEIRSYGNSENSGLKMGYYQYQVTFDESRKVGPQTHQKKNNTVGTFFHHDRSFLF